MKKRLKRFMIFSLLFVLSVAFFPVMDTFAEVGLPEDGGSAVITAFEEFDVNEHALNLLIEYKPSLEEILDMMPNTLEVYLNGSTVSEAIDVSWYCVGEEYEESESFYFQFSPVWDEGRYLLSDEIDLLTEAPYIAVFFRTEQEGISTFAVTNSYYETFIFDYLTDTLGYHTAAACGAMANIYSESAFIPINLENTYEKTLGFTDASYTQAVDRGTYTNFANDSAGYGLCQWTYRTRKQGLLDLAKSMKVSIGDPGMQLSFLDKELMAGATGKYMKSAPNTEKGCYDVAYYFCQNFERPAQVADEKSIARGNLAKNYYWEEYSDAIDYTISISGQNKPGNMKAGSSFSMKGTISSGARIRSLTAGVYDYNGKLVTGKTIAPNVKNYDLSALSSSLSFSTLSPGIYYYKVSVTNALSTKTMINSMFVVLATGKTVTEGTYMVVPMVNRSMVLSIEKRSNESGARIYQESNTDSKYQYFQIAYAGSGYYTLKNNGSGLYLEVPDGNVTEGAAIRQNTKSGKSAQNGQILPVGNSYCLIPQSGTGFCLSVEKSATTAGAKILTSAINLGKAQKFQFITGDIEEVFRDVSKADWYIDYLNYVYKKGLMNGNDGLFEPNSSITKSMVAQVLYNLEGKPAVTDKSVFSKLKDVYEKEWYGNAVAWAYSKGVVTGDLNTKEFSPNAAVTREQLALMFYRYAVYKKYNTQQTSNLEGFQNAENVSNWAAEGMRWAVGTGLVSGIELKDAKGTVYALDLAPQKTATRAQMAAILMRFYEKYK